MEKELYNGIVPIIDESEYEATKEFADAGDPLACLQLIHYFIFCGTDPGWFFKILSYAEKLKECDQETYARYAETVQMLADDSGKKLSQEIAKMQAEKAENKRKAFEADPYYTAEGEVPNAVLIDTDGDAILIRVDGFDDSDDLGAPLGCSRVDRVMNRLPEWGKKTFDLSLVGYVDANGIPKGLDENERIQSISGYDYIAGDCVLVGMDKSYNYLPLDPYDAVTIWKYFCS